MAKILLVEDDISLANVVRDWLKREQHVVEMCDNGNEALDLLKNYQYELLVLDLHLPDMSGLDVLKGYRSFGGTMPVLILTGQNHPTDISNGLDLGADDYVTKPFNVEELLARVRAVIRRQTKNYDKIIEARGLLIDINAHKVTREGVEIKLQAREFALLEFLLKNAKEVFSIESLLNRIWPTDSESSPDTVRVCITKLRSKLDVPGNPSIIRTVHRVGYQIDLTEPEQQDAGESDGKPQC